jgi:hypothetical protein
MKRRFHDFTFFPLLCMYPACSTEAGLGELMAYRVSPLALSVSEHCCWVGIGCEWEGTHYQLVYPCPQATALGESNLLMMEN